MPVRRFVQEVPGRWSCSPLGEEAFPDLILIGPHCSEVPLDRTVSPALDGPLWAICPMLLHALPSPPAADDAAQRSLADLSA
jgi:hypothetical protein